MSFFHSHPVYNHGAFASGDSSSPFGNDIRPHVQTEDRAIDAALRSVPLPEGLMTRLGMLVYAVADETADQVDWLGC
jgi:hypothetical protein